MSYQSFSRKKKKPLIYLILIVVFILYIIINALSRVGFLDIPLVTKDASSSVGNFFSTLISDKQELIEENNLLKEQIRDIEINDRFQQDVFDYNTELLSRVGASQEERVVFDIYSRPGFNLYDSVIVSGGDTSKIKQGDTFYSSENFVLGEVREVRGNTLVLGMYSSSGVETNITLNNSIFIAEGLGSGTMEIKVPRDFVVEEGDLVYRSGSFLNIIGEVRDISTNPQDSFKIILIKTPINIFEISKVEVEIGTSISYENLGGGILFQEEILDSQLLDEINLIGEDDE